MACVVPGCEGCDYCRREAALVERIDQRVAEFEAAVIAWLEETPVVGDGGAVVAEIVRQFEARGKRVARAYVDGDEVVVVLARDGLPCEGRVH